MTKTVDKLIDDVLRHEGGYVNDPDDPGGATNYGVTIHTMRRFGLDVTGDGVVDIRDVKSLTEDDARRVYKLEYFEKPRIGELPEVLQPSVFDMYVNSGGNAIKILQRTLSKMGYPLDDDGALGPKSIGAANDAVKEHGEIVNDVYSIERRNYYFKLADNRPASRKYAKTRAGGKGGWIKRAEEFMRPKFRLSDREFKDRVAKWG